MNALRQPLGPLARILPLLLAVFAAGCEDDRSPTAVATPLALAVTFDGPPAESLADAFDKSTRLDVVVSIDGRDPIAESFEVRPGRGEIRARISIPIEDEEVVTADIELTLFAGADPIFTGLRENTQLEAGDANEVPVTLEPIPAGIAVETLTIETLAEPAQMQADVVFATGDVIPGLQPTFSTTADAISVTSDGLVTAEENGTFTVTVTFENLSETGTVQVQAVATIDEVAPSTVVLAREATLTFTGRNLQGGEGPTAFRVTSGCGTVDVREQPTVSADGTQAEVTVFFPVFGSSSGEAQVGTCDVGLATDQGSAFIEITLEEPPATRVEIDPTSATIEVGETIQIDIRLFDEFENRLSNLQLGIAVDNNVATLNVFNAREDVDPDADLTGEAEGSATFTFSAGNSSETLDVTVVPESGQTGSVEGRVVDATTDEAVAGATVTLTGPASSAGGIGAATDGPLPVTASTDSQGRFFFSGLAPGFYQVQVVQSGLVTVILFNVEVVAGQTITAERILVVPQSSLPGDIGGQVLDATTGDGIVGATVELREGQNRISGPVVATTTTSSGGSYFFGPVDAGTYTAYAMAPGFVNGRATVVSVGENQFRGNQNVVLSPSGSSGEIRIVLTWGSTPPDLDSHLTGPLSGGGRFHVFFGSSGTLLEPPFAQLDQDDTDGFGPETITFIPQTGLYRYSVHDFTNSDQTSGSALANSGAKVEVFDDNGLVQTFFVPNAPGTLWTVFEFDGGVITPVNAMSFESDPTAITVPPAGDATTDADRIHDAVGGVAKGGS